MTKEELIKSLKNLRDKLDSGEFDYCNLIINEMTILFCSKIKVKLNKLFLCSRSSLEMEYCIDLADIKYLKAFAITSEKEEIKLVITYNNY